MTDTEKLILEKLDMMGQTMDSMNQQMNDSFETLNQRIDIVDEKLTKTNLTIENDISRKIDIIGEGHDFLKQRLDEALQMEKKRESMELELINLRMEINKIKEHLDIA